MPIISSFFGILIKMYFGDHNPPHFHAEYQGERATFDFKGKLLAGRISSPTACKLIKKWAVAHELELKLNWKCIEKGKALNRIEPLD